MMMSEMTYASTVANLEMQLVSVDPCTNGWKMLRQDPIIKHIDPTFMYYIGTHLLTILDSCSGLHLMVVTGAKVLVLPACPVQHVSPQVMDQCFPYSPPSSQWIQDLLFW